MVGQIALQLHHHDILLSPFITFKDHFDYTGPPG